MGYKNKYKYQKRYSFEEGYRNLSREEKKIIKEHFCQQMNFANDAPFYRRMTGEIPLQAIDITNLNRAFRIANVDPNIIWKIVNPENEFNNF